MLPDWVNDVPVKLPGLYNLTYLVLVWTFLFCAAFLVFLGLARSAWESYVSQAKIEGNDPERLYALARVIAQGDSLLITLAGIIVGLLSASNSHASVHLSPRDSGIVMGLMAIALGKLVQGVLLQQVQAAAARALAIRRVDNSRKQSV